MMSPTPSCTLRMQARSAEKYSTSTVDRTLVGGSTKRITRRSLLTTAGASITGVLLAEDSLCAAKSNSTITTTPGNISASFWQYDIDSFVEAASLPEPPST